MVRLVSFLPQFWHYTNMMGYSALHNVVFLYQGNWFYQFEIFKLKQPLQLTNPQRIQNTKSKPTYQNP